MINFALRYREPDRNCPAARRPAPRFPVRQCRTGAGIYRERGPQFTDDTYLSFTYARAFNRPTHTMPMSDAERKLPSIG